MYNRKTSIIPTLVVLTAGLLASVGAKAETRWFGYANVEYNYFHYDTNKYPQADMANVAMIMQHDFDIYQFLTEVEYSHAPAIIAYNAPSDGGVGAYAKDHNAQGEIAIERAYANIELDPMLKIRLGKDLTPTLWLTNHYPNIITPITAPQLHENSVFEENYIGAMAYGKVGGGVSYKGWFGNGGGNNPGDDTTRVTPLPIPMSTGAKLSYDAEFTDGTVSVGVISATNYNYDTTGLSRTNPTGYEVNLSYKHFSLWAEGQSYKEQKASYAVGSYSFGIGGEKELVPFYMYDQYKASATADNIVKHTIGLNFKPKPTVIVKGEYQNTPKVGTTEKDNSLRFAFVYFFN